MTVPIATLLRTEQSAEIYTRVLCARPPSAPFCAGHHYSVANHGSRAAGPSAGHDTEGTQGARPVSRSLSALTYDNLGRRTQLAHANGVHIRYGYDDASRLSSLVHDLPAGQPDQTWSFTYNAAGQVETRTGWNPAYDPALASTSHGYTINGLNQATTSGAEALDYDLRGNLTTAGAVGYKYDRDNHLEQASVASVLGAGGGHCQQRHMPVTSGRNDGYSGIARRPVEPPRP
jgi:YD repeat-containing protein